MAASWVEICNSALGKMGGAPINDLDDESKTARACKRLIYFARDEVLRAHTWACAQTRQALAALEDEPLGADYTYQFALPTDPKYIRLSKLINNLTGYEIVGQFLLSDEPAVTLQYVYAVDDPGVLDSAVANCIATRLAVELAVDLAGDEALAKLQLGRYNQIDLPTAKAADQRSKVQATATTRWNEIGR